MNKTAIGFWISTALVSLGSAMSGLTSLSGGMAEGMAHLGYPAYFAYILGSWKLAGVVALLSPAWAPWVSRVKEWAYAGFSLTFTGAALSYIAVGDGAEGFVAPLVFLLLLAASYALRPDRGASGVSAAALAA